DRSDGQVARENAVHAARDDPLADIYIIVVRNIFHGDERLAHAADGALDARVREHGSDAALSVGEKQHLRSVREGFNHFSHDAVGSDDSHVLADAVMLAAIDLNGLAGSARTAADHTRSHHGNVLLRLTEMKQCGKAIGFSSFAFELGK